jgi:hypothetical protein
MADRELNEIQSIENYLNRVLPPVKPTPEFVNKLRFRLVSPSDVIVEQHRDYRVLLIMLLTSLLGGVAAIIVWRLIKRSGSKE